MTIRSRQLMYRVQGPDGRWVRKGEAQYRHLTWTSDERSATFWKRLGHLKNAVAQGIFSKEHDPEGYLEGLPLEALTVVEYQVDVRRTGRKKRLTELDKFKRPRERNEDAEDQEEV